MPLLFSQMSPNSAQHHLYHSISSVAPSSRSFFFGAVASTKEKTNIGELLKFCKKRKKIKEKKKNHCFPLLAIPPLPPVVKVTEQALLNEWVWSLSENKIGEILSDLKQNSKQKVSKYKIHIHRKKGKKGKKKKKVPICWAPCGGQSCSIYTHY